MLDKENSTTEAEQLTDAYHKARRLLALFSGILISWEYVGISLGDATSKVASATLPIANTPINIRNPEVFPVVILTLVLYFAFRLAVEWNQCDKRRTALFASQVDLIASYLLSGGAILLYVLQQTFPFRLADFLTPLNTVAVVGGIGTTIGSILFLMSFSMFENNRIIFVYFSSLLFSIAITTILFFILPTERTLSISFFIGSVMTITVTSFFAFFYNRAMRMEPRQQIFKEE